MRAASPDGLPAVAAANLHAEPARGPEPASRPVSHRSVMWGGEHPKPWPRASPRRGRSRSAARCARAAAAALSQSAAPPAEAAVGGRHARSRKAAIRPGRERAARGRSSRWARHDTERSRVRASTRASHTRQPASTHRGPTWPQSPAAREAWGAAATVPRGRVGIAGAREDRVTGGFMARSGRRARRRRRGCPRRGFR